MPHLRRAALGLSFGLLLLGWFAPVTSASAAPYPVIAQDVGVCDPNSPKHCLQPNADGSINLSSISGLPITAADGAIATLGFKADPPCVYVVSVGCSGIGIWEETNALINSPDLGAVTTAAPTYTTGTNGNLSLTTSGGLRVDLSGTTGPASPAVTPIAGAAHIIVTGGAAVTFVTGPVKGCYITNPLTLTDQNIATAEPLYVNPVTTATTSSLNGSSVALAPGQTFYCPAGQTTNISADALTSSHNAVVVVW